MNVKVTHEIDGNNFDTLEGFYEEVSRVLIPNTEWGKNLDAFNDILRGGFGTPNKGFIIRWKNSQRSREKLGYEETIRQVEKQLKGCHPTAREDLQIKHRNAKKKVGPTVFNWIVEIIHIHCSGGHEEDSGVELRLE